MCTVVSSKCFRTGGEGGIRTLDTGVSPYNGLANRRLQPLGHLSATCFPYTSTLRRQVEDAGFHGQNQDGRKDQSMECAVPGQTAVPPFDALNPSKPMVQECEISRKDS